MSEIRVTSDVRRDILQSAGLFNDERKCIWEYVSNGLQYKDRNIAPEVHVQIELKQKKISIIDNGKGMTESELSDFFTMHGENKERKAGRPGRGRFGTGKSAAFGIANKLVVRTIRNNKLNVVQLRRADIESSVELTSIPVKRIVQNEPTHLPNGTTIEVSEITIRKLDITSVIKHIRRQIGKWPRAKVFVNGHAIEIRPPESSETYELQPSIDVKYISGCTLRVSVANAPLEDDSGIAIFANEVFHEQTLSGHEGNDHARRIFGEINVPALEDEKILPSAFDMARSNTLNRKNPVVNETLEFIHNALAEILAKLKLREQERRREEEQARLR